MKGPFFYVIWDPELIFGSFKKLGIIKLAKMTEIFTFFAVLEIIEHFPLLPLPKLRLGFLGST